MNNYMFIVFVPIYQGASAKGLRQEGMRAGPCRKAAEHTVLGKDAVGQQRAQAEIHTRRAIVAHIQTCAHPCAKGEGEEEEEETIVSGKDLVTRIKGFPFIST